MSTISIEQLLRFWQRKSAVEQMSANSTGRTNIAAHTDSRGTSQIRGERMQSAAALTHTLLHGYGQIVVPVERLIKCMLFEIVSRKYVG